MQPIATSVMEAASTEIESFSHDFKSESIGRYARMQTGMNVNTAKLRYSMK